MSTVHFLCQAPLSLPSENVWQGAPREEIPVDSTSRNELDLIHLAELTIPLAVCIRLISIRVPCTQFCNPHLSCPTCM